MERGEPPDEEIEMEWQKMLRQANQRSKEMEQQRLVSLICCIYIVKLYTVYFDAVHVSKY